MATEKNVVKVHEASMPSQVARMGVLPWRDIRDKVAPQGSPVSAKDMVGRVFTLLRYRKYLSAFAEGREMVYWCVVVTDDGELFNFTLGGTAVCDVLDAMDAIKREHAAAMEDGSFARARELEELGADKLWQFDLQWIKGGQGEGYYTFA